MKAAPAPPATLVVAASLALAAAVSLGLARFSYALILPANTTAGGQILAYTTGGTGGVAYAQNAAGSVTGFDIWGTALRTTRISPPLSPVA